MTDKLLIEALEREKFNAWYSERYGYDFQKKQETWPHAAMCDAWEVWQAAHRSQQEAAQEPRLCGFCGKSQHQVKKLLATPCAAICDECNQTAGRVLGTSPAPSESEARDAARYRWLRQFLDIDDVGDEQGVYQLVVRGEDLEIAAGQAKAWGIREYLDEIPDPDAAIDAALSASGQKGESQ